MVVAISFLGIGDLYGYLWFALLGAAAAGLLVHAIAALGRDGASPVKIAVAGAAVTAAVVSWTSAILLTDRASMLAYRQWAVGTVGGRDLDVLLTGLPFLLVGGALAMVGARLLDALALGDDVARSLGRRTAVDRVAIWIAVVLLAGTATALAGPIAFVGLVVPHGVRAVVGPKHSLLLPWSALVGAVLVLLADTVGRVVMPPGEVQVGIMAAVVGVPCFLVLVRRTRVGGL
jgi:iron complex transport system permease protein